MQSYDGGIMEIYGVLKIIMIDYFYKYA